MDNPNSLKTRSLTRSFSVALEGQRVNEDGSKTIRIALSSEYPVQRDFGMEVLDHSPSSVDMSRLMNGAPFLVNHDQNDQVGVLENVSLDADKKIRADVRFSRSQRGQDIKSDIEDGIRKNISVGYQIRKMKVERNSNGSDIYKAVQWMPFEASTVPVPADPTVGVSRSADLTNENDVEIIYEGETEERGLEITTDAVTVSISSETVTLDDEGKMVSDSYSYTTSTDVHTTYTPVPDSPEEEAADQIEDAQTEADPEPESVTEDASETEPQRNIPLMAVSSRSETTTNTLLESRNMDHINVSEPITLSAKEKREYSYSNAIKNILEGKRSGIEFEISDTLAKNVGRGTDGFYIPTSMRAMDSATAGSGAELVFTEQGDFITALRANAVVLSLGAKVVPANAKVSYPRQTGVAGAQWIAENGTGATAQDLTFDSVTLDPKQLIAQAAFSRKLMTVSPFAVDQIVRDSFVQDFAIALDKAALQGAGSPAPSGILTISGTNAVAGTSGSLPTFAMFVDAETKVLENNAGGQSMAYVVTPGLAGKLKQTLKNASGTDASFILSNGEINGYKAVVSSNLTWTGTASHPAIFGDFSKVIMADGGAIEVIVDKTTYANVGNIVVTGQWLADVAITQPKAFSKLTNLKTA